MTTPEDRNYFVGETIVSTIQVNKIGSRTPIDPASVALTTLRLASTPVALPPTTTYTKINTGQYRLNINSTGMTPGVYTVLITVTAPVSANPADPQGVVVIRDTFVLSAA